jgi:hypothetical protein
MARIIATYIFVQYIYTRVECMTPDHTCLFVRNFRTQVANLTQCYCFRSSRKHYSWLSTGHDLIAQRFAT